MLEIQQLHEKIRREFKIKLKFSKELMDMKKQVHTLISTKDYEVAEALKNDCDMREQIEKQEMDQEIEDIILK